MQKHLNTVLQYIVYQQNVKLTDLAVKFPIFSPEQFNTILFLLKIQNKVILDNTSVSPTEQQTTRILGLQQIQQYPMSVVVAKCIAKYSKIGIMQPMLLKVGLQLDPKQSSRAVQILVENMLVVQAKNKRLFWQTGNVNQNNADLVSNIMMRMKFEPDSDEGFDLLLHDCVETQQNILDTCQDLSEAQITEVMTAKGIKTHLVKFVLGFMVDNQLISKVRNIYNKINISKQEIKYININYAAATHKVFVQNINLCILDKLFIKILQAPQSQTDLFGSFTVWDPKMGPQYHAMLKALYPIELYKQQQMSDLNTFFKIDLERFKTHKFKHIVEIIHEQQQNFNEQPFYVQVEDIISAEVQITEGSLMHRFDQIIDQQMDQLKKYKLKLIRNIFQNQPTSTFYFILTYMQTQMFSLGYTQILDNDSVIKILNILVENNILGVKQDVYYISNLEENEYDKIIKQMQFDEQQDEQIEEIPNKYQIKRQDEMAYYLYRAIINKVHIQKRLEYAMKENCFTPDYLLLQFTPRDLLSLFGIFNYIFKKNMFILVEENYFDMKIIDLPIEIQQVFFSQRRIFGSLKQIIVQKIKRLLEMQLFTEIATKEILKPNVLPYLSNQQKNAVAYQIKFDIIYDASYILETNPINSYVIDLFEPRIYQVNVDSNTLELYYSLPMNDPEIADLFWIIQKDFQQRIKLLKEPVNVPTVLVDFQKGISMKLNYQKYEKYFDLEFDFYNQIYNEYTKLRGREFTKDYLNSLKHQLSALQCPKYICDELVNFNIKYKQTNSQFVARAVIKLIEFECIPNLPVYVEGQRISPIVPIVSDKGKAISIQDIYEGQEELTQSIIVSQEEQFVQKQQIIEIPKTVKQSTKKSKPASQYIFSEKKQRKALQAIDPILLPAPVLDKQIMIFWLTSEYQQYQYYNDQYIQFGKSNLSMLASISSFSFKVASYIRCNQLSRIPRLQNSKLVCQFVSVLQSQPSFRRLLANQKNEQYVREYFAQKLYYAQNTKNNIQIRPSKLTRQKVGTIHVLQQMRPSDQFESKGTDFELSLKKSYECSNFFKQLFEEQIPLESDFSVYFCQLYNVKLQSVKDVQNFKQLFINALKPDVTKHRATLLNFESVLFRNECEADISDFIFRLVRDTDLRPQPLQTEKIKLDELDDIQLSRSQFTYDTVFERSQSTQPMSQFINLKSVFSPQRELSVPETDGFADILKNDLDLKNQILLFQNGQKISEEDGKITKTGILNKIYTYDSVEWCRREQIPRFELELNQSVFENIKSLILNKLNPSCSINELKINGIAKGTVLRILQVMIYDNEILVKNYKGNKVEEINETENYWVTKL
ncbi:Conserved_hypothetical protein [Hexamita inflata]|uniref:Uncharacterized protein n=1 Tax=Hexamita inflata TaxID=28002 RepID=A0AA86U564_9EUKA|nr:Conserved hypothetical protein [Hexamita inflata]